MPFPQLSFGRVDKQLTNLSLMPTESGEFIHDMILPVIPNLKDESGIIPKYGKAHLKSYSCKRDLWDESEHRIKWELDAPDRYDIEYFDIEDYIPDRLKNQFQAPIDAYRDSLLSLETIKNETVEQSLADVMSDTTIMTNSSTPTTKWNATSSTPLKDMEIALESVRKKIGRRPNKCVIAANTLSALTYNDEIKGLVSGIRTVMTQQQVIDVLKTQLGLDQVLVGSAVKNTAKDGQTDVIADIWDEVVVFYYAPNQASLKTSSFGYRFELTGQNARVTRRPNLGDTGEMQRLEWAYQDKILNVDASYLLYNTLT